MVVDPRNLPLKFGKKWFGNIWDIVVVFIGVAVHVIVVVTIDVVDPRNLPLK